MEKQNLTIRNFAVISGIALLLMAVLAGIANFTVVEKIKSALTAGITGGDILQTMAAQGRWAVVAFSIVAALDVIVAWSLYGIFRPDMPSLSLLTAWFRLLYTAVFGVAITVLFTSFRTAQAGAVNVVEVFRFFEDTWMIALFFFGIHLVLLGWLSVRSRHIHWIFGLLLIIAGAGYLFDTILFLTAPDSNIGVALYTFIGEVVFIFWLLIKGSRIDSRAGS